MNKKKTIKNSNERFIILIYLIALLVIILFINLFYIQIVKYDHYYKLFQESSHNIIEGSTAPRGRIYDRNHKLLVDNTPVKVIYYKKQTGISTDEEIKIAYKLVNMLELNYEKVTDSMKRNLWVKMNHERAQNKITEKEVVDLKYRKLKGSDIEKLKLERITEEELNELTETDIKAAYIYYLMNKGYSYSDKIIKDSNVTDSEYAVIASKTSELKGVGVRLDWNRTYIYGNTFKSILGSVSTSEKGIPEDLKDYYLSKGYTLTDRVGTSYLEYQYDDYLRGTKNKYEIKNGEQILIEEGTKGNDIVLTIDIELQKAVEEILEEELIKAKEEPNTEFYNRSFVIVTDPKTGEILAMAGKQIINKGDSYEIYDYTPGIFTSSVTVGSAIKGASHIVGYNTGALQIGEKRYDTCVKLKGSPIKCSWKSLGLLDDITALKQSSNTYQFYTALKVAAVNYYYDMPFVIQNNAFEIYRNTFKEFGLGVKTGIDLPNESDGLEGKNDKSGLLLDFAIGQYDNYTPLQLSQYISTIANNGNRMKYYLLKNVYNSGSNLTELIYEAKPEILNNVNTEQQYLDRVKEGFKVVLEYGGTGSGYIDRVYLPAGKTGTSQSFVDTNSDGIVDTETVSNTFVGYAPYDNPKVTFTVISPDTYNYKTEYQSYVNKRISKRVSQKYFEIYG